MNNFFLGIAASVIAGILLRFITFPSKQQVRNIKKFAKFLWNSMPHKIIYSALYISATLMMITLGCVIAIIKILETGDFYYSLLVFITILTCSAGYFYFNSKFVKSAF